MRMGEDFLHHFPFAFLSLWKHHIYVVPLLVTILVMTVKQGNVNAELAKSTPPVLLSQLFCSLFCSGLLVSPLSYRLVRLVAISGTGQPLKWRNTDKRWKNWIHYYIFHTLDSIFTFQWICLMSRLVTNAESSVLWNSSSARNTWGWKIEKLLGHFLPNFRVNLTFLRMLQYPRTKCDSSAKKRHRALFPSSPPPCILFVEDDGTMGDTDTCWYSVLIF